MRRSSGPALLYYSYCLGLPFVAPVDNIVSGNRLRLGWESWSNWFSRIAETDHHRWSVMKNGAAGADYGATPDADSGSNEDIGSDPGFRFDHDRRGEDVKRRNRDVVRPSADVRSL
jgi:hypothetical protein